MNQSTRPPRRRWRSIISSTRQLKVKSTIWSRGPQIGFAARAATISPIPRASRFWVWYRDRRSRKITPSQVSRLSTGTIAAKPPMS